MQVKIKPVEDVDDRLRGVGIPDEGKHELRHGKMQGQKDLAAFPALYGVHFYDRSTRVPGCEVQEILISPPDASLPIHLEAILLLFSFTHAHDTGHVKVPGAKDTAPYIIVEGTFIHHDLICMAGADMVKGLALHDEGAY